MTTVNVHINSPKNKIGLKFMRWAKKNFCLDKQCNNSSNFIISFYDKIILKELIFTLFLPSRRISREKVNSLTIKIFIFVWIFVSSNWISIWDKILGNFSFYSTTKTFISLLRPFVSSPPNKSNSLLKPDLRRKNLE